MSERPAGTARLKLSRLIGYGAGDVANNLTFSLASAFLLIYYTDVAGIAAGTAGTIFLIVRVWGGFTDLVAGTLADRTSTRWGRFRPYVLLGAIPLLALNVALFSIPSGLSDGGKVVFAYVSYALFSLAYSFVNIPYGSLSAAMTQRPDDRARISTIRIIAASVTILLIAIVVSPQIEGSDDLQRSLSITTVVIALVGFMLYLWCFLSAQEVVARSAQAVSLKATAQMVRHNRPLVLLCASSLLFLTGMFSLQAVGVFYARDVLGNAGLYIVLMVVQTVAMILAALVAPNVIEAVGKRKAYLGAAVIAGVGGVGVATMPDSVPALGIAAFGVLGFGIGAINTLIFALQADTVDYGEWKSGLRAEGSGYALLSFTRKAGQGVGGAAGAYTLGLGGYVSGAASQPDGAETAIRVAAGALPAGFILAAAAVMLIYPLTEMRFREIVAELAAKRAGTEPANGPNRGESDA